MKTTTRRIVVDGRTYLWRRSRSAILVHGERCNIERLTIFLEGRKRSPATIFFRSSEVWSVDYLGEGILASHRRNAVYNLSRPAVVRAVVMQLLANGWTPEATSSPWRVEDGFALLASAGAPTGFA